MRSTATMVRSEKCPRCGARFSALDFDKPKQMLAAHIAREHGDRKR